MANTRYVSVRDIQRNYKQIGEEVSKTNVPAIVMRNQEPQFVIISMEMFDKVQKRSNIGSAQRLLEAVNEVEKLNIQAPPDLSRNLDKYTWD